VFDLRISDKKEKPR